MNWFIKVLKEKYAVFDGRAQRAEYWYFTLFYILAYFAVTIVDRVSGSFDAEQGMGILGAIYALAMLIPALAVGVRRLHDTDRSGWWLLLGLVPVIGAIVLLVFMVLDGTPGDNRFGPNPKLVSS